MKIFAFATKGTSYVPLAHRCRQYFKTWLDVEVVETINRGQLIFNIFERTHQMLKLARKHENEPVGWVDADVVPYREPKLILDWEKNHKDYDIALTCRPTAPRLAHRHCAGVVLWPPGGGKGLEWLSRTMDTDPNPTEGCREQLYISRTISEMGLRVQDLGNEYNDPGESKTTIIHHPDCGDKPQHDLNNTHLYLPDLYEPTPEGNWRIIRAQA